MTPERYQQVKSAFRLALEVQPDKRIALLTRICADDPMLMSQVLGLLETDVTAQTVLDKPAVGSQFRLRTRSLSYTATSR